MEKEAIQNKEKNFVSCVLYLHNDGKNIREFLKTVCGTMEQNFEKYEIVCVNDCCMDDTIEEIHRYLEESNTRHVVSLINLSFYQGVEMAMTPEEIWLLEIFSLNSTVVCWILNRP